MKIQMKRMKIVLKQRDFGISLSLTRGSSHGVSVVGSSVASPCPSVGIFNIQSLVNAMAFPNSVIRSAFSPCITMNGSCETRFSASP
jgi:hypothetical protein